MSWSRTGRSSSVSSSSVIEFRFAAVFVLVSVPAPTT
jgi:hypothetical protein